MIASEFNGCYESHWLFLKDPVAMKLTVDIQKNTLTKDFLFNGQHDNDTCQI
jgi:hypothetical protein